MNVRLLGPCRPVGPGKSPRHSHGCRWHAGYGRACWAIPGTTLVAGLCRGFGLLPTVGCSVNVGNRGSCISVATEISLAQLREAKAMMPAMAKPTPFMLVPLIIAKRMITRSRPNPE